MSEIEASDSPETTSSRTIFCPHGTSSRVWRTEGSDDVFVAHFDGVVCTELLWASGEVNDRAQLNAAERRVVETAVLWAARKGDRCSSELLEAVEALAAAPPARILPVEASFEEAVGQALGAASMCWDPRPSGVFDSVRCAQIYDELMKLAGR